MRGKETKKLWENPEYKKHMSDVHMKDNPRYSAIHKWVRKWKGKPACCENCGKDDCRLEWANIDHSYKRVLEDYIALCISCHKAYDKENNGRGGDKYFDSSVKSI